MIKKKKKEKKDFPLFLLLQILVLLYDCLLCLDSSLGSYQTKGKQQPEG